MTLPSTRGLGVRRGLAVIAMSMLVVAACSDDDDPRAADSTGAPSSTDAPTTTDVPSTEPAPSTEGASTTEPAAITPPPTTAPPTTESTESTTSTTTPSSPTDAAVAAFNALNEARHRCIADLQNCDPATAYAPYLAPAQLRSAVDELRPAQDAGYVTQNLGSLTETIEDVKTSSDQPDAVDIQFCGEDGVVLVRPGASGESVVNDRFVSNRAVAHMRLDPDGTWRLHGYTLLAAETVGEENSLCA